MPQGLHICSGCVHKNQEIYTILSMTYLQRSDSSFPHKRCQISAAEALHVGTAAQGVQVHIWCKGRVLGQGLQDGCPGLWTRQRHIKQLVQPPRPAAASDA